MTLIPSWLGNFDKPTPFRDIPPATGLGVLQRVPNKEIIVLSSDTTKALDWNKLRTVEFIVTPELSESRTVNYLEISEMRQAGGLLVYIGTQARTYTLNARFVSRTPAEADVSYTYTHVLKSWAMPDKTASSGSSSQTRTGGEQNAPEVLRLYGYGHEKQIRGVPVVLTSLNIEYPSNVSYIYNTDGDAQVPIIQNISIGLKEARNMDELNKFSLASYKDGTLQNW